MTFSNPSPPLFEGLGAWEGQGSWRKLGINPFTAPLGYCPVLPCNMNCFHQLHWIFVFEYMKGWASHIAHHFISHDWGCMSLIPQPSDSGPLPFHAGNMQRRREGNEMEDPWCFLYQYRKKQSQSKTKRQSPRFSLLGGLIHCLKQVGDWPLKFQITADHPLSWRGNGDLRLILTMSKITSPYPFLHGFNSCMDNANSYVVFKHCVSL